MLWTKFLQMIGFYQPLEPKLKHEDFKELYNSLNIIEQVNNHFILGGVDEFYYIKKSRRRSYKKNKSKLVLMNNGTPMQFKSIEAARKWIYNRPYPYY